MIESKEILALAVKAADSKRAEDIVAIDVKGISFLTDYFLVCHGNSDKQVLAIANELINQLEEHQVTINRVEGKEKALWILIDAGDVIAHVFYHEERDFYRLEKLWSQAPFVDVSDWIE